MVVTLVAGCATADRGNELHWPTDTDAVQLGLGNIDDAPVCTDRTPVVTGDSLGPLSVGLPLAEALASCPDARLGWNWGDEGVPSPAIAVRFGSVPVLADVADTVPSARVTGIWIAGPGLMTPEGLGVGSSITELEAAYGTANLVFGECVIYALFDSLPGLAWRLRTPEPANCAELSQVPQSEGGHPLRSELQVQALGLVDTANA